MKNIHLLPTDKPSRLSINCQTNLLQLGLENRMFHDDRNIYITSDEEIKERDAYITKNGEICKSHNGSKILLFKTDKKIILTTDQDLIKDGVQAIDDEFLQWIVKNPSCEEVEINSVIILKESRDETDYPEFDYYNYEIIIPKEEPKQETLEEAVNNFKKTDVYITEIKQAQERSYSEEEVLRIITSCKEYLSFGDEFDHKKWFEQFKKK